MRTGAIASVLSKQLHFAIGCKLVELVKCHAGHASLVLFPGTINVEIPEANDLPGFACVGALEADPTFTPHALVKEQFGVTVHIQRALKRRLFPEGVRPAVGGCTGGVKEARAPLLASLKQGYRGGVVVLHHVLAVGLHGVATGSFVKYSLNLSIRPLSEQVIELVCVHVVSDFQIRKIAKFVALRHVIHGDDVIEPAGIEPFDDIAANKTGGAGDNDSGHANNSS